MNRIGTIRCDEKNLYNFEEKRPICVTGQFNIFCTDGNAAINAVLLSGNFSNKLMITGREKTASLYFLE
jgi:hypothetical protein